MMKCQTQMKKNEPDLNLTNLTTICENFLRNMTVALTFWFRLFNEKEKQLVAHFTTKFDGVKNSALLT